MRWWAWRFGALGFEIGIAEGIRCDMKVEVGDLAWLGSAWRFIWIRRVSRCKSMFWFVEILGAFDGHCEG